MLTGNKLIKTIKENAEVSKSDIVKLCGYTSVRKNGTIKLNYTEFYQALLEVTSYYYKKCSKVPFLLFTLSCINLP